MTFFAFRYNTVLILTITAFLLGPISAPYTQETGNAAGVRDQLEEKLSHPPGSDAELAGLTALLNRFNREEQDPVTRRWFQYRVDLAREYRNILDYTYFEGSTARFDRDLGRSLLETTYTLKDELSDGTFTPAQRRTLQDESRRNVRTFFGVMMLAADYQTVLGNVREQSVPYDILFKLADDGLTISGTVYRPYAERTASEQMAEEYLRSVSRQRPLLQALLVGTGAAAVTTSALIYGTGMPDNRNDRAADYVRRAEETPDQNETDRLLSRADTLYDEADTLELVGRTAAAAGVVAIVTGAITYLRSTPVPRQVMRGYLDRVGNRRFDTAISFFEGREEDRLFLVRGARADTPGGARRLQIGGQPAIAESGPAVYTRVAPGEHVSWQSVEIPEQVQTHVMHSGRNVVFVP